jgi:hypothetical protein
MMLKNLIAIFCLFFVLAALYFLTDTGPLLMAPSQAPTVADHLLSIWQLIGIGATMLVGIVFGNFHAALARAKRDQPALTTMRSVFNDPDLYKALLASPIIFGGVYTATLHSLDPVVAFIFAFQNGFFCEALLRKQAPK